MNQTSDNGQVVQTSTNSTDSGDITALARLSIHVKENNLAYLVGLLIAHSMGLTDKMFTYGSGLCG